MSQAAVQAPIVLLGDTLLMMGVELALVRRLAQPVMRVRAPHDDLAAILGRLRPSLVLFDLDDPQADALLPILKETSELRLIGMDRSRQIIQRYSCQQQELISMDNLAEIIQAETDLLVVNGPLAVAAVNS